MWMMRLCKLLSLKRVSATKALLFLLVCYFALRSSATIITGKRVLLVGGTRFTGLYLWRELYKRGHHITLFNRGKTEIKQLHDEDQSDYRKRVETADIIVGDRNQFSSLKEKLGSSSFDVVYDLCGRDLPETAALMDALSCSGKDLEHFIYMSSAGVYRFTGVFPYDEDDAVDELSRHAGKLRTEQYLFNQNVPFTSVRPTYIYGPLNYNKVEKYFFEQIREGQTVVIPGNGQSITGFIHASDLAVAMAQVIGRDHCKQQIYNIQNLESITFTNFAHLCHKAMQEAGIISPQQHYSVTTTTTIEETNNEKNLDGSATAARKFPFRGQHFFCSALKAVKELDWEPQISLLEGLKDSVLNDFK